MEVYCIQVKREFPDSGINQVTGYELINNTEQNHFILPDIKNRAFINDHLQLKTDPKEEFEVSLRSEDFLGTLCTDKLTSKPKTLKLLDVNSPALTFDQKLETVNREMVFENHGTIYPQGSLDLQEVNLMLSQVGIKEELLSSATASDTEIIPLDYGLEGARHHNTRRKNSRNNTDPRVKGYCANRRTCTQRKAANLRLPCLHCRPKRVFKSHDELRKHHLRHERVYILNRCFYCSTTFKKFDTLRKHMTIHYLRTSFDSVETTDYQRSLDAIHLHDHNYCDPDLNSESIRDVKMSDILFQSEEDLEFQLSMHSRGKKYMYRCDYCEESFDSKSQIAQHLLKCHSSNKCNHCNQIFPKKSDFIPHILSHWVEKLHKCSLCEKVFNRKSALREHMFSHSDEELTICRKCGKAHPWTASCKVRVPPRPIVTQHKCSHCGESFPSQSSLMSHIFTHLVLLHECNQCRKQFESEDVLKSHICGENKTGQTNPWGSAPVENYDPANEKPFKCHICKRAFCDLHSLNIHILSHCGAELFHQSIIKTEF